MFKEKFSLYLKKRKKIEKLTSINEYILFSFYFFYFLSVIFFFSSLIIAFLEFKSSNNILTEIFLAISSGCLFFILHILKNKIKNYINTKNNHNKQEINNINTFEVNEILDNIQQFTKIYNGKFIIRQHFNNNEDLFIDNLKDICLKTNYFEWIFILDIKSKKKLLLSDDLEWYSKHVSITKLYDFFKEEIEKIIHNNEIEHYFLIYNLFQDFLEPETLLLIHNRISLEQKISIIHI